MGQSYRDLIVWQRAMDLVTMIYQVSASFPREEIYGLTSQVRRAAVSVPSNIAEGQGRATRGEFKQFLGHARGSLYEMETQVQVAIRLAFVESHAAQEILEESVQVAKLLNALISSISPPNN